MRSALAAVLAALVPARATRERNRRRVRTYGPERFDGYRDYFWFGHVDPVLRWWHAIGMLAGVVLFLLAVPWRSPLLFLLGVVSFYGLGYISHVIHDGGAARTDHRYFVASIPWIVEINVRTLRGRFEPCLRDLVERYPFVREAYGLGPANAAPGRQEPSQAELRAVVAPPTPRGS